jgi:hypothetical protein
MAPIYGTRFLIDRLSGRVAKTIGFGNPAGHASRLPESAVITVRYLELRQSCLHCTMVQSLASAQVGLRFQDILWTAFAKISGLEPSVRMACCPTIRSRTRIDCWHGFNASTTVLLMIVSGWVHPHQLIVIEFLQAENQLLKKRLRGKRTRFTDPERVFWGGRPGPSGARL